MYDLSGLYYQMKINGLLFGLVGLLLLICSKFWIKEKKNIKDFLIGIIACILCVCSLGYHIYVINDLEVSVHEGMFLYSHRESPYLFRDEYCFSNESGLKSLFDLDIFSKKKICPGGFEKGVLYRIYYEEKTYTIVKVEKL